jgi:hypothetical protein
MLTTETQVSELPKEMTLIDLLKKIRMIREMPCEPHEENIEKCIDLYIERSYVADDNEKQQALDFISDRKNQNGSSLSLNNLIRLIEIKEEAEC